MNDKVFLTSKKIDWLVSLLMGRLMPKVIVFSVLFLSVSSQAATLPQLMRQALNQHPQVRAQQAIIDVKEVGVATAKWQYYPTLSANYETVSAAESDASFAGDSDVTTLNIEQPIWSGGLLAAGVDIASSQVALEHVQLQVVKLNIAEAMLQAYGQWLSGYKTMQAWDQGLNIHQKLQNQVQNRVDHGVSAPIDLTLAKGRLASTQVQYLTAESEAQLALDEINQLTQRQFTHQDLIKEAHLSAPVLVHLTVQEMWAKARSFDPQIALAQSHIGLAQFELQQQKASISPRLYFRAEQQVNSFSNAQAGSSVRFFLGLSGSSGAGLSVLSKNNAAAATVAAKEAALVAVEYTRRQNLVNLMTKIDALHLRIETLSSAMTVTLAVSKSYSRQFLAGRKTWQEVLNSAREQVQMEVQMVDLEAALLVAQWRLALITSGLTASGDRS
jgi:adhesin transport system outer membrane protein